MAFSLDDLITPLTVDQAETAIYDTLARVGTPTTSWQSGSVIRTMIKGASIVLAACSELTAKVARSGFLELAEGSWLDLVAHYVYGVDRDQATFGSGSITLTNTGGGIYSLDVGDLVALNPSTNRQYRNSSAVSLGAGQTATVPVIAVEAGSASTSAPGAITKLVTSLLGVSVSNANPIVGLDAESDASLRARCREQLGAVSPFGPWDAYSSAVRGAKRADGSRVGVTRIRTTKDGYGNVVTYVASASGGVTGTRTDLSSDLGVLDDAIQRWAAPLAVTASAASASPVTVNVSYRVWMYNTSGLTEAAIVETIRIALVLFMAAQPIGGNVVGADAGKIFVDAIRATISKSLPAIFHCEVTAPATDVVLSASQVPVLGTVTAQAIVQVPPTEGAPS